jgi:hypothetical protein
VAPTVEDGATEPDVTRAGTARRAARPATAELSAALKPSAAPDQLALFTAVPDPAAEALRARLRALDPDTLTPMQALALLAELTTAAREGGRG